MDQNNSSIIGPRGVTNIPISISVSPNSIQGGSGSVSCTIQVNATPANIKVSCGQPTLLGSPSGSWPYLMSYSGSVSQSFNITTQAVAANTVIQIYACSSNLDINNPANWQVLTTLTLTP